MDCLLVWKLRILENGGLKIRLDYISWKLDYIGFDRIRLFFFFVNFCF